VSVEPRRRSRWDDPERPPVLLLAGFPEETDKSVPPAHLIGIEEAVLSFTRAALASGNRIALPADRAVVPLVAAAAAEYVRPLRTEARAEEAPRVEIALSGGRDPQLEAMLARAAGVAARHFTADGEVRGLREEEGEWHLHTGRHPLTRAVLEAVGPRMAVVVGGDPGLATEVGLIEAAGIELAVIGHTLADASLRDDWTEMDPTLDVLERIGWPGGRGKGQAEAAEDRGEDVIPYPYLMQWLFREDEDDGVPVKSGGELLER
jgi:hypothetical protein